MALQAGVELILAIAAALLLLRDVRRAWRDPLRRPVTLFMAALIAALLIGVSGGRTHPSGWWLLVPGAILAWEVARGWRRAPRSHLWEAAVGGFAAGLAIAALGLGAGNGETTTALLGAAAGICVIAVGLLWLSHRREPPPSRAGDASHYERRSVRRPTG